MSELPLNELLERGLTDPRYVLLPCGHSAEQAAWLGCTETECRPEDARLSAEYFAERAMRRGQVAPRGRPS